MSFEWDENKRLRTLENRNLDFNRAIRIFEGFVIEWESDRGDEQRFQAVGCVESDYISVVYTWREGRRRIISARMARRAERVRYDQAREDHQSETG